MRSSAAGLQFHHRRKCCYASLMDISRRLKTKFSGTQVTEHEGAPWRIRN